MATVANLKNAIVLSLGTAGPSILHNEISVPVFGVTAMTILACAFGTFAAIGYDESRMARGRQLVLGLSTVILGASCVGVIPAAMGWTWNSGGVQGASGALTCLTLYYLLPPAIKRAKELVANFNPMDWLPGRRAAAAPPTPPVGKPDAVEDPDK